MNSKFSNDETAKNLTVRLLQRDIDILERYRGELSVNDFLAVLLRMIDTGAVKPLPNLKKRPFK